MLSWNEIHHRAIDFSQDWQGTNSEKSEYLIYRNEFFGIFRPNCVLVEHRSNRQDLDETHQW